MKKHIRSILSLVLALSMALALAACGSGSSSSSGSGDSSTDGSSASSGSDDKVYTLIVTNHDSSTSVGEQYVETLLNQISEESGGRLQFSYNPGGSLYGGGEAVEAVRSGAADICWNATSITVGVFPISEFINVPLNGITCAQMGSKVFQDMMAEIPECAAEFDDFYVIAAHDCSVGILSTVNKKIETVDDLQGLNIRSAGTVQSNYINMIGCSASSMATSEVYEALSKNVVEGMTNDWHNIDCFNLYEVVNYIMDYPINSTSCFMLMNKDTYESLPEDLQAIFDKYQTYASDMAGYYWDCMRFITGEKAEELGVEIYEPSEEVYDYLTQDEFQEEMAEWFVEYLDGYGYDGQAIYDQCMEIVARYADEYTDPYATEMALEDWDMDSVNNY
ncbi:MAG: TRAP transporter substrate-binding protein DctP [Oscillospiraceae bacterium]|nr:TRAP transporter substrate-binding protein DctP [Oscillospiraceae bacterium]